MNRIYRLVWNHALGVMVAVAENAKGRGKSSTSRGLVAGAVALTGGLFLTPFAQAGPNGGQVSAGAGTIAQAGTTTTINQSSQNLAINWQGFSIAANEAVRFNQPNASAVALNRVIGQNPSQILGALSANGQVFVVNPNGVLFGATAQVNVGGLVASTLGLSDADLMANRYTFNGITGLPNGSVVNQGAITAAQGGYIALLAPEVRNEGVISANLGTALLAAGNKVTVNLNNGSLLSYAIDQGAINALADNKQLIQADGGQVFMGAKAANALTTAVVNNTGVLQARTAQNVGGVIKLMGDMETGTVNVGGTLDASAPAGGNGGFVETSAAHVKIANGVKVTTLASNGLNGTWLIDPVDFTIAATGGDMTGAAATTALTTGNLFILSSQGTVGGTAGDINVNDAVSWSTNSLVLTAQNNININAVMTATGTAGLGLEFGQGAVAWGNTSNVITGVNGKVNLPAGTTNFTTLQGSDGVLKNYTVITTLGAAADATGGADTLQGMAATANASKNYALGADIDATATATWNTDGANTPVYAGFTPIGKTSLGQYISGIYDGLGHTISNLTINRPLTDEVGLISSMRYNIVRNMGLVGGSVTGQNSVGGLAGRNYGGKISNSFASTNVTGQSNVGGLVGESTGIFQTDAPPTSTQIIDSHASGNVVGSGSFVGGLVGKSSSRIINSYASGNVTSGSNSSSVGGLVGESRRDSYVAGISDSYAIGNVSVGGTSYGTGGLVGSNTAPISGSHATGQVQGSNDIGGLVGVNRGGPISASYALGTVSGNDKVGGLVGYSAYGGYSCYYTCQYNHSDINASYASGSVTGANNVGGLVGSSYYDATINTSYATGVVTGSGNNIGGLVGGNDGTVIASYHTTGSVTGTSNVGGLLGYNGGTVNNSFYDMDNVTVNGATPFAANGIYASQFSTWQTDGLIMNPVSYFGAALSTNNYGIGSVQNMKDLLGFTGSDFAAHTFTQTANFSMVTMPAGYNLPAWTGTFDGAGYTISNFTLTNGVGNVGLFSRTQSGSVIRNVGLLGANVSGTASSSVGALVGSNGGTVSNNYTTGQVSGGANSYVGGLVGYNNGTIENSHSIATVSNTTGGNANGLVGAVNGPVTNSHYDIDVSHNGVAEFGLYTSQLQDWLGNNKVLDITRYSTSLAAGSGADTGYYLISDAQGMKDLLGFADQTAYKFRLTRDVDLSTTAGLFIPKFSALEFDGAGHVIDQLSINQPTSSNIGMFGTLDSASTVTRLGLTHVSVAGNRNVGGLVGTNYGTVSGSYVSGSVSAGAYGSNIGGLVGYNRGAISASHATGSISSGINSQNIGGLVGYNSYGSTISNSYAKDSVSAGADSTHVGGLSGYSYGTLTNSHYDIDTATLAGIGSGGLYDTQFTNWVNGGMAALNIADYYTANGSGFYQISSLQGLKDLLGFADSNNASYKFLLTANLDLATLPGYTIQLFAAPQFDGGGKTLDNLTLNNPTGENVGFIGTLGAGSTVSNLGLTHVNVTGRYNVGALVGFNYGGTITNSYATGAVTGAVTGAGQYGSNIGGLVGRNSGFYDRVNRAYTGGTISNSYATATVISAGYGENMGGLVGYGRNGTISNSYATGEVRGEFYGIGGLAGYLRDSTVTSSYATGAVTGTGTANVGGLVGNSYRLNISNSYATGSVSGSSYVGGLMGVNSGGTVSTSYATGSVSGSSYVGALVGANYGTVSNSVWNTDINPVLAGGTTTGATGLTTAQMHTQANFTTATAANGMVNPNWDFAPQGTWVMVDGASNPLLATFIKPLTVTVSDASKTYNGLAYSGGSVTYSASDVSALQGTLNFGGTSQGAINAGSYTISASGLTSGPVQQGFSSITYVNGALTVDKAHLTVTANDASRAYGAANPTLTTTVTGFVNNETALTAAGFSGAGSATTTAGNTTNVGSAVITAAAGTLAASNYDFATLVNGTLTINAPVVVTPPVVTPPVVTPPVVPPAIVEPGITPELVNAITALLGGTNTNLVKAFKAALVQQNNEPAPAPGQSVGPQRRAQTIQLFNRLENVLQQRGLIDIKGGGMNLPPVLVAALSSDANRTSDKE
jgi:filamentous hemagglutinin family protein